MRRGRRGCASCLRRWLSTDVSTSLPTCSPAQTEGWFRFEVVHESRKSRARVGRIHTPHGVVDTPVFVPVGTVAALKHVPLALADAVGMQLMFVNTYHMLLLNPQAVALAGGLHRFMGRPDRPLITDSGGFQVFSLQHGGVTEELASRGELKRAVQRAAAGKAPVVKVSEDGVLFRSYRDGQRIQLTPESSVDTQKLLGADIILPLDELPPYHTTPAALQDSTRRSHRWMARSLARHLEQPQKQAMYGIVHGGVDAGLRAESAAFIGALPFDGNAIGGALGKDRAEMCAMLAALMPQLAHSRPRHLLGIGDEASLRACVPLGVDTFDSAWPTRAGRHGELFTSSGTIKLRSATLANAHDRKPDDQCSCTVCANHSLAYLHHLYRAREPVLATLAALHNVAFTLSLMARLRSQILADEV
jgi:queuine tRNA-ribosyltransferase